jgi:uncharacterized damage-inducible protein DinB
MGDALIRHFRAMARNNAWANDRLLGACALLSAAEFAAPRIGFFPSLRATLNHVLVVDLYYIDALEEGGLGMTIFAQTPVVESPAALRTAQGVADRRLIAFCDRLHPTDLERSVLTDRGRPAHERIDHLLAHLFQHQIHHRGQAHAMLSSTRVAPPQLDEFFLDFDRHPSVAALGLSP